MRLLSALPKTTWTLLDILPDGISTKTRVLCRCVCGTEKTVRAGDIIAGNSDRCASCASRIKGTAEIERRRSRGEFYSEEERIISRIGRGARKRCRNLSLSDYGGRGITFTFSTIRDFVGYVMSELGPRPTPHMTLDRIDNEGGYSPGNLRWATRSEQNANQRPPQGDSSKRLRKLCALKPEFGYESLRTFMKAGLSDSQILNKVKSTSGRPRISTSHTLKNL